MRSVKILLQATYICNSNININIYPRIYIYIYNNIYNNNNNNNNKELYKQNNIHIYKYWHGGGNQNSR